MANEEHLAILKQGVDVWNAWVKERRKVEPKFRADLTGAYLTESDFTGANLIGTNFTGANLTGTNFTGVDFSSARFTGAYLNGAHLYRAYFYGGRLTGANLTGAHVNGANFSGVDLTGADLSKATVGYTTFAAVDLSRVKGLDEVQHEEPSTIGIDTLYLSQGKIPHVFLKGAGVPDDLIDYIDSFICGKAIHFYSCFISYSSRDQEFAERLHADMQSKGLRVWFAPEDLKIGDRFRQRIEESIRVYDKLLVLLSENSVGSSWVASEVEAAFEKERGDPKRTVLFPVRLDDAVMNTREAWAADIRRTRHIGDFTRWKDHDAYKKALDRLLRDLKADAGN